MVFLHGLHFNDNLLIYIGLSRIYGIGIPTAISICKKLLIPSNIRFSQLSNHHITLINNYLSTLTLEARLKLNEAKNKNKFHKF